MKTIEICQHINAQSQNKIFSEKQSYRCREKTKTNRNDYENII